MTSASERLALRRRDYDRGFQTGGRLRLIMVDSGDHWRGMDALTPVWNLLELTPEGREEWFPSTFYAGETAR